MLITLKNSSGASVTLTSIGAGVVSVVVPDKNGKLADVALGYRDEKSYFGDGPCSGKIPGRFANRIAFGKFTLEGREYSLAVNNGPNHLHGGPEGFSNKEWSIVPNADPKDNGRIALFSHLSPDGDEGYPGALKVSARYCWSEENVLSLEIRAESDRTTILNLTNHTYWNLAGENSGSVLEHELQLNATHWLPTDSTLVPTGEIAPVAGTPMDFLEPKKLGKEIKKEFPALIYGKGYDNCWVVDGWRQSRQGRLLHIGTLSEKSSGRALEVYSTQPGVQVYTGNWLAGSPISKSGRSYNDYDGVAIECQNFPDAPNKKDFPTAILHKGEEYVEKIEFRFVI